MRVPKSGRVALVIAFTSGCTIAPGPGAAGPGTRTSELPTGQGTLRQEDVSLTLVSGDLQLLVTPLHESVTRVTAPDTERRLEALADAYGTAGSGDGSGLFLVSFFSNRPDVGFDPEEVQLVARGFRLRPASITPLTPSWGERRVGQREQVMAVYRFAESVDLESELVLVYALEETSQWNAILPRIQAERARVRARAGVGR
ncbi:MAG TPA: hypothetical protein VM198_10860 [Longimicrobiales bacterium]|nr:hypothetical protein [Longimicrobiales bacterium]